MCTKHSQPLQNSFGSPSKPYRNLKLPLLLMGVGQKSPHSWHRLCEPPDLTTGREAKASVLRAVENHPCAASHGREVHTTVIFHAPWCQCQVECGALSFSCCVSPGLVTRILFPLRPPRASTFYLPSVCCRDTHHFFHAFQSPSLRSVTNSRDQGSTER